MSAVSASLASLLLLSSFSHHISRRSTTTVNGLFRHRLLQKQLSAPVRSIRMQSNSSSRDTKKDWSADQYLKFAEERTRPARDLLAQVPLQSPKRVIDLGCGPGNSTAVLAEKYAQAHITGVDSSPDMIAKARKAMPNIDFSLADLNTYRPSEGAGEEIDLFFSNAVFQWLPPTDRVRIITNLIQTQRPGGVFAFQVPDNFTEPSHRAMRETAAEAGQLWSATLGGSSPGLPKFQSPNELYDALKPFCSSVNIWHTSYYHVLENHEAIVEWVKGTGLRPFLDPLSAEEKEAFLQAYLERLKNGYPESSVDRTVLLKYPRLFVVAVRA
jgi:trans-aconitate 2-methyltransferase